MVVDERARHDLHTRLVDVLGDEEAATLMAQLPPVGWADVARRDDIDRLERRIDGLDVRFDSLEQRMDGKFEAFEQRMDSKMSDKLDALEHRLLATVRADMNAQMKTFVLASLGSSITTASLVFAAVRL